MARKKHTRPRDLPHPRRDREFREGRGKKRGGPSPFAEGRGGVKIGGKHFEHAVVPKRPPILFLYEDLADLDEVPPVFGMYPRALIAKLLPWLRCERREVLHVCSGGLPKGEGIRVDIRPEARPDVVADGRALPFADGTFADGTFAAVMLDPPYTPAYAKELYGTDYPRPAHLLAEAARVVRPGGRVCFVHYITANPPPACRVVKVFGLSMGFGFPMRAVTIYEREQAALPGVA